MHTIKPLDKAAIILAAQETGAIVTAENANYFIQHGLYRLTKLGAVAGLHYRHSGNGPHQGYVLKGHVGPDGTWPLHGEFPDRVINVGIAEANMVGVATGLAEHAWP